MPIHRQGNALVCVGTFLASGAGATGLSVSVDVYELPLASGTPSLIVSGGAATEIARGAYYYRLAAASVDATALYVFLFNTSGTADQKVVAQGWTAGMTWTENIDEAITSRLASAGYTAPDNAGIAGIKAQTDQFVFTLAGKVDASIQAAGDFAQAAADKVWGSASRTLTSFGTLVADAAAAVWEALASAHNTPGTMGDLQHQAGSENDPWETLLPNGYPDGSAGAILGNMGSTATFTQVSPILDGGVLELVAGDAYDLDHGRALDGWALTGQPSLEDATVTLVIAGVVAVEAVSVSGVGSSTQVPVFELTAEQTSMLTRKGKAAYRYQIQAVWPADDPEQPAVLAVGDVTVIERLNASA